MSGYNGAQLRCSILIFLKLDVVCSYLLSEVKDKNCLTDETMNLVINFLCSLEDPFLTIPSRISSRNFFFQCHKSRDLLISNCMSSVLFLKHFVSS